MALNDTSSLALLASFPDLPSDERKRVEASLTTKGRAVAEAIRHLQEHNGFSMTQASSPEKVAALYLNWANAATVKPTEKTRRPRKRRLANA